MSKPAVFLAIAMLALIHSIAASQTSLPAGPPSSPMTIPLPDPLFWDPVTASGDYAVVDQQHGLYLLRPATGRIIARLHPPDDAGATSLGMNPPRGRDGDRAAGGQAVSSPDGWPFRPGDEVPCTPVIGDVDGDRIAEVVFATRQGWIWVVSADGLPPAGWPVYLGVPCYAGAALADINGDGLPEILVGDASGRVHAFLRDGSYVPGWPTRIPGECEMLAIYGAVAAADIDRDGRIEVAVTQAIGRVCVFKADGSVAPGWPVSTAPADDPPNAGTIFSHPALADLDGDGKCEVIVGANSYRVYIWTADGRAKQGWPRLLDNRGRAGYADPVLADLNGDGLPEILIATDSGFSGPARIYALDAQGRNVPGWPVNLPERCNAGVAVGDLDHNGKTEVVAATVGEDGYLVAFDSEGRTRRGFPVTLPQMSVNSSPILADVDGDGRPDIVLASLRTRFEPSSAILAFDGKGEPVKPFPIPLDGCEVIGGGPCVADMNGDGRAELLLGTEVEGRVYAWNLAGSSDPQCIPWPRPGGDRANTGVYRPSGAGSTAGRWGKSTGLPPARPPDAGAGDREPSPPGTAAGAIESPFSPLQSVSFILPDEGLVRLCIMNIQRETVRTLLDGALPSGAYTIAWDGKDSRGRPVKAGIYIYDLEIPRRRRTGQLLLVR